MIPLITTTVNHKAEDMVKAFSDDKSRFLSQQATIVVDAIQRTILSRVTWISFGVILFEIQALQTSL